MYRNRISHWAERGMKPCHPYGILTFITFLSGITGARLTTSPTQITIGGINPTSQLTVRCGPDSPVITTVHSIEIGKKSSTGSNQPIIRMSNADSSVQVLDTSLQQRMTVSGSITGATGSIQFTLENLRCVDAASTYYCSTLYLAGSTANITAKTYPEQIQMFPTPDRGSYDEGQMISFRCTGRIGNQFDVNNLQNLWTWEYRSIDNEFTSWTRYPNDQNITYEPPTPVSGSGACQYNGASTLLHTVSTLDNGRQFRCSVIKEDYSDNKTVFVVGQQPIGTPSPGENSGIADTSGDDQANVPTATFLPGFVGQHSPILASSSETSTSVTGARLTTSPTQITIGGSNQTSQLTVSCSPDAPGITQVYTMEIGQTSSSGYDQSIIQITKTDSSVQVVDTSLQQRMTATGSITGATGSLQFILTDLKCTDAASTYYCSTLYLAGSAGSDEATANITARTYPEQIEMFPTPDRVSYDDGQLISFRCTGRIGNQFDENNLQKLWTWEWRSVDNEIGSWTRYPNYKKINYEPPSPVPGSGACQYNGASTLLHTVSNLENGRQFRCSVINEDYSDNKTVFVIGQVPSDLTSRPKTSTRDQQTPGHDTLGVGVAIGVGVMLAVIAICLSVVFIYRNTVAGWLSGAKETSNTEMPVLSNIQAPAATVIAPVGIQTQDVGDEYEIPVDRSHYDALQRETEDIANTYEKIRTYQDV